MFYRILKKLFVKLSCFFPESQAIESYVMTHGMNAFYDDVLKKKVVLLRYVKFKPLQRALDGYKAWITGIRRAQSVTRMSRS